MSAPTAPSEARRQSNPPVPLHFLVPGFSKCGTTTLCALLNRHPDLYLPAGNTKEPRFFSASDYEAKWDWYASLFAAAPPHALIGEGSQSYGGFTAGVIARQRILGLYPDIKLIFIARDPIDRIESSYREFHQVAGRGPMAPFHLRKALDEHPPSILENTRYRERIENFTKFVRPEQIHVALLEELVAEPDRVLAGCFDFLGVDPDRCPPVPPTRLNPGRSKLYDTQRLRWIRRMKRNPDSGRCFRDLDADLLDPIFEKAGLRKRFSGNPMRWPRDLEEYVLGKIADDILEFLATVGRSPSVWPRFAAALARRSEATNRVLVAAQPPVDGVRCSDTGCDNNVAACDGRIEGTLRVVFRGDDNRIEIGRGVFSGEGSVVRVRGERNRLVLEDDVALLGESLLCIDGCDNQVRLSRGSHGEIVVFVETDGGSIDVGRGVSFKSGTPLVIGECRSLEWRVAKGPGKGASGEES